MHLLRRQVRIAYSRVPGPFNLNECEREEAIRHLVEPSFPIHAFKAVPLTALETPSPGTPAASNFLLDIDMCLRIIALMKRWILLVTGVAMAILMVLSLTVWKNWIKASFYIRMMEADFRQENMQVDRIVETLRIRPGQEIADIGAGSGLFTRKFARRSKGGVVFAADINEELLQHIAETAREEGLKNVETVLSRETDPDLPRAVDLIFLCDTLHFIERQADYMKVLSRYLKPEGRIAVISFAEGWPPLAHEFTEKELIEWMESLGFRVAEKHDFIKDQYLIIFDKHGTGDQIGPARM